MNRTYRRWVMSVLSAGAASGVLLAVGCGKGKPATHSAKERPEVGANAGQAIKGAPSASVTSPGAAVSRQSGRDFAKADAKERQALDKAFRLLRDGGADPADRMAALSDLIGVCDPDVVKVAKLALECGDKDQRELAMELLVDFTSPEILPLVSNGLADAESEVRAAAIQALGEQHGATALAMVGKVLDDPDADVRKAALSRLFMEEPAAYAPLVGRAVTSAYPDLREQARQLLFANRSHAGFEVLLEGMRATDPVIRDEVRETISGLVSEEFDTYDEARAFWDRNQSKFDDDLIEK